MRGSRFFLAGGAGCIGSHFTDRLLADSSIESVVIYDNFITGKESHYAHHSDEIKRGRLRVVRGDINDMDLLTRSMKGSEVVIHLASNADISKAAVDPDIDFREGTVLTRNVLEAMRLSGAKRILYTSGSGVYGDLGLKEGKEDYGPMIPVSTYGASKLAGESLMSAYCYMFGLTGCAFRFGNVVGARQTHGVGYDFLRRLKANPRELTILGDGLQSKSYVHVSDIMNAVFLGHEKVQSPYEVFNVATGDYVTVREIASATLEVLGINPSQVEFKYTGGAKGWKGDVPVVRINNEKIRGLGWKCEYNSLQAIRKSLQEMLREIELN